MQLADALKPTGEPIDPLKSHQSISTNTRGSQAGGVRLDGNLTSDFLVADMSNSVHTWDLDKGEDGKDSHKIVEIMTVSLAHTFPRTQTNKQKDKQTDK